MKRVNRYIIENGTFMITIVEDIGLYEYDSSDDEKVLEA